jgi:cobalamin biosynthesis protein CobD/CbiB
LAGLKNGARVPDVVSALAPDPVLLAVGVAIDLALGDPVYAWHPIRIVGRSLSAIEAQLRRAGFDGYGGGILLFVLLGSLSLVVASGLVVGAAAVTPWPSMRSSSTACWRSATSPIMSGASSARFVPAISRRRAARSVRLSAATPIGWMLAGAGGPPSRASAKA